MSPLLLPLAQIPLIERPDAEPIYFVHIYLTGETLYLSDRNFKFNSHDYEAYLLDIPETVHSIERFGGYLNINASLAFRNMPFRSYSGLIDFFILNPLTRREMDLFVLFLDRGQIPGTDVSTKLHRMAFGEIGEIKTDRFSVALSSILHLLDRKKLFLPINRVNWPNADPNAIGRFENNWVGNLRNVACHCVSTGAASTISANLTETANEVYLSNTEWPLIFPSEGTIQIDEEKMTYTGKDTGNKKLTGLTRGTSSTLAAFHKAGAIAWVIQSSYKYLAAGHKMKSISNAYVGDVRLDTGEYTVSLDDGGKSTITVTKKALNRHAHGQKSIYEMRPTSASHQDIEGTITWTGADNNTKDLDENTKLEWGYSGTIPEAKTGDFIANFAAYTGDTPDAVYVCVTYFSDWEGPHSYGEYTRLQEPEIIDMGATTKTTKRIKLSSTTVPTQVKIRGHTNAAGSGGYYEVDVYEVWLEIERYCVNPSGSAREVLAPAVTCDGEGYQDDGSGTYTGTPNALIQNPSDVMRYVLQGVFGRSGSEIGISFGTARTAFANRIPGGYKFGCILSTLGRSPEEIFRRFNEQSRSQIREDAGKFELSFDDGTEPPPGRTIDKTIYAEDPAFSYTPEVNIRNVIRAVFDYDWSGAKPGRYGNYNKEIEVPNLNGQRMLANFDGENGATSFTDFYGNVFTRYNGATISTAAYKFGTASIRLPGSNGEFRVPSNSLNQFTIEFFFRMDDKTTPAYQALCAGETAYKFQCFFKSDVQKIGFNVGTGSGWLPQTLGTKTSWDNNTWYHLEFSYDGYTYRVFVDGILDASYVSSQIIGPVTSIRLGYEAAGENLVGYEDEFRFTPYCLHTEDFTPPSQAYSPDIVGEQLPEDVEMMAVQDEAMARDVADYHWLQKHDVVPTVHLRCNRRVKILQRGDYFTLNNCPVAAWEGSKWKVLEIHKIPDRQEFRIQAIKWVGP